jgi:hypothetical protein
MIHFSTKHWPLVVLVPQRLDAEEVAAFIADCNACYARRDRFASLVDLTLLEQPPDALQRRALTDWASARAADMQVYSVATAMVVQHPLVRGALTAVQWLVASPRPIRVVATPHEGTTFLLDALAKAGIPVSPSLHAYHASLVSCRTAKVEVDAADPPKRDPTGAG